MNTRPPQPWNAPPPRGQGRFLRRAARRAALALSTVSLGLALASTVERLVRPGLVPRPLPGTVSLATSLMLATLSVGIILAELGRRRVALRRPAALLALGAGLAALSVLGDRFPGLFGPWVHGILHGTGHFQVSSVPSALSLVAASLALLLRWPFHEAPWKARQGSALLALVPFLIGNVVLISYAAGAPMLYGPGQVLMSLPAAFCVGAQGAALLAGAGLDVWPMAVFGFSRRVPAAGLPRWLSGGPAALVLILGGTAISLGAAFYLRGQLASARDRINGELRAIADLKARQISLWLEERRADAELARDPTIIRAQLEQCLAGASKAREEEVLDWMRSVQRGGCSRVVLLDRAGRVRLQVAQEGAGPIVADPKELREALAAPDILVKDLHRARGSEHLYLSFWVPLRSRPGGEADGVLLLSLDPRSFLFPHVQAWPTPSASAETLLVRRDGEDVVYLNDLRFREGTALSLRLPLATAQDLPAVAAVKGVEGLFQGRDYRGEPVLAYLRTIPGQSWHMVAKVDESEVYGPLRQRVWVTGTGLMGLLAFMWVGLGMLSRQREAEMAQAQLVLTQRYESLMREANDIILILDPEGRILEANQRAVEAYGRSLAELQALDLRDLGSPQSRGEVADQLDHLRLFGGLRFETVQQRRDGTCFPVEVSARMVAFEGARLALSFVRDISDRVARERELLRLNQLYAARSEISQAIVWSGTRGVLMEKICQVLVEAGGFSMAWIARKGDGSEDLTVEACRGDRSGYLDRTLAEWGPSHGSQGPVGTAIREGGPCVVNGFEGQEAPSPWHAAARESGFASMAAFPIREGGRLVGALAVCASERDFFGPREADLLNEAAQDLSFALDHLSGEARRREAEEALQTSERLLREAQAAGEIGTYVWDIGADHWRASAFMEQILGIGPDHPRTLRGWLDLVAPEAREPLEGYLAGIIQRRERFDFEYPIVRPSDRQLRWLHGRGEFQWGPQGRPLSLTGVIQDITEQRKIQEERRQFEAQLHQSQKLESLGSLAGGVAHDMNNVLGAILGLASTLREREGTGQAAKSLDIIISACQRGRGVVKSLLYFAHKDLQEERPLDLNALVRDMAELLSHTTLKKVQLRMELFEGLPRVRGDAGALSHALMNLCVNAVDAMPGGGVLVISTALGRDGSPEIRVKDTGEGMAPEVLAKAMEPFFTTKPVGKGTGLGLSMVYGTLKAHEGTFELHSEVGVGTEALLRFPSTRIGGQDSAGAEEEPPPPHPGAATLRILLVDDDELIRESVASMLEAMGHAPTLAADGRQALDLLEEGLPVDRVILDMNMPGMGGSEALPRIRALRPGTPVIIATGYSDLEVLPLIQGMEDVSSIRKPFSLKELEERLARAPRPQGV